MVLCRTRQNTFNQGIVLMDHVLRDVGKKEVGITSGHSMSLQFIADAGLDILNHKTRWFSCTTMVATQFYTWHRSLISFAFTEEWRSIRLSHINYVTNIILRASSKKELAVSWDRHVWDCCMTRSLLLSSCHFKYRIYFSLYFDHIQITISCRACVVLGILLPCNICITHIHVIYILCDI